MSYCFYSDNSVYSDPICVLWKCLRVLWCETVCCATLPSPCGRLPNTFTQLILIHSQELLSVMFYYATSPENKNTHHLHTHITQPLGNTCRRSPIKARLCAVYMAQCSCITLRLCTSENHLQISTKQTHPHTHDYKRHTFWETAGVRKVSHDLVRNCMCPSWYFFKQSTVTDKFQNGLDW